MGPLITRDAIATRPSAGFRGSVRFAVNAARCEAERWAAAVSRPPASDISAHEKSLEMLEPLRGSLQEEGGGRKMGIPRPASHFDDVSRALALKGSLCFLLHCL